MSHDALCPGPQYADLVPAGHQDQVVNLFCRCDLIAAVRADERVKNEPQTWFSVGYTSALHDAVAAVKSVSSSAGLSADAVYRVDAVFAVGSLEPKASDWSEAETVSLHDPIDQPTYDGQWFRDLYGGDP